MDAKIFISPQSRHIYFVIILNKVIFSLRTLTWRVNNYVSRQEKGINKRNRKFIFKGQ